MKIVWELTVADANVVLEGLGELPTKRSGPLAMHLKAVADSQVAAFNEAHRKGETAQSGGVSSAPIAEPPQAVEATA